MTHTSTQTSHPLASGLTLRKASARGHVDFGWLKSAHSFSFGEYYDPEFMQFGALRVINDDYVAEGKGFPMHAHKDAEIFSYVLDGSLSHKDSLGNGSTVTAGGVQYMSAGTGVSHSEFNPSTDTAVKFLQIWLLPNVQGQPPRYETLDIAETAKDGRLKLFLSEDGREGSMAIKADANIYAATLKSGQVLHYDLPKGRKAWIQMARGELVVNKHTLKAGDGLSVEHGGRLEFSGGNAAEFILFDLA